jgi:spore maturation protein CgeB
MRFVLFCHSLISDWNHGNAHFLRGVCAELLARGHAVRAYEPRDAWSVSNMLRDGGEAAVAGFHRAYPGLSPIRYDSPAAVDLEEALDGADVVLVHEWNHPELVERIGRHRARGGRYLLFFHDTHHRTVSDPAAIGAFDLSAYDGVLAFGEVIRERYASWGWGGRAWTWHEAADVRMFFPLERSPAPGDLVWIGNWGDDERSREIGHYLIEPVREMGLSARVFGVRYPADAIEELRAAGIRYEGWLPNYRVPQIFAGHRATVHIPRRPYVEALPGIPTIRIFEALACGIPLVSSFWSDSERLFTAGRDFLLARSPQEMRSSLRDVLEDSSLAAALADCGRATIRERHTCAHRVDELIGIISSVRRAELGRELTV